LLKYSVFEKSKLTSIILELFLRCSPLISLTSPGQWNFGNADNTIAEAQRQGQQVLFILSGAPVWCGGDSLGNAPCPIDFWKTYVDQVSSHFQGRVAAYEIWNEPDLQNNGTTGVGWNPDLNSAPTYVDYLVEASRIIRRSALLQR
jgi:GH35 family endo-1,4-beta-xylanase